ncbi:MAG: cysteine--tRNA ligase [Thermodesulfobacteriota bacterium]
MAIKLYNTLTGKKEVFEPLNEGEVRMYVCGPTVYDLSHIGHARSAVAFDAIYRYLQYRGYKVTYTRNYTDVDDKIIKRAADEGVESMEIAERYIKSFDRDMEGLGVALPTRRPRATETIPKMLELIETLMKKGFAYAVDGDVYYSVRKFEGYGKLSGKNIEDLESGARVEVDERKEDPLDFALWKASKPGEPTWDSPWGPGRPGWHIECSAMCLNILGETFDIHGGGKDLIFPHHENEIAQSEAATGKRFARYWLHNGFVNIEKEKMSKSIGNILNIHEVLKNYTSDAMRLFLLSSHYRSPIDYTADTLPEAEAKAERFYRTLERMEKDWAEFFEKKPDPAKKEERLKPIVEAMDDDFNTAAVIGKIFEEVGEANRLMDAGDGEKLAEELPLMTAVFKETGSFLGTFIKTPGEYFGEIKGRAGVDPAEIEKLIAERNAARASKNFKRADEIRDELKAKGVILEDTSKGTEWKGA